ncbi:complex I intermediate-associated protein 30-domain-containing protein [Paraphysoderma sedebokerense]|nr:complex I intermediate-associated protein 30-domain-containing protein [Paraphysoderma sedebokerense]
MHPSSLFSILIGYFSTTATFLPKVHLRAQDSVSYQREIFGAKAGWDIEKWYAVDDRVRGGISQSYLSLDNSSSTARFHGTVDTTTLGGAGFASQQYTSPSFFSLLNLKSYSGISISTENGDNKVYSINLKTEIPKKRKNGRNESLLEWKYLFPGLSGKQTVTVRWNQFIPYYRGRPVKGDQGGSAHTGKDRTENPDFPRRTFQADDLVLKPEEVKTISIMCASLFGKQNGTFSIDIASIDAIRLNDESTSRL